MKIQTRFICETCGSSYLDERLAKLCEVAKPPPCPIKIGDCVDVYERYDAPQPDSVIDIFVGTGIYNILAENAFGSEADRFVRLYESCLEINGYQNPHPWKIKVKNNHQVSKDEDGFTDVFGLEHIYVNGKSLA